MMSEALEVRGLDVDRVVFRPHAWRAHEKFWVEFALLVPAGSQRCWRASFWAAAVLLSAGLAPYVGWQLAEKIHAARYSAAVAVERDARMAARQSLGWSRPRRVRRRQP